MIDQVKTSSGSRAVLNADESQSLVRGVAVKGSMSVLDQMPGLLPWAVAAWLLGIGLYAIVTSRNFIHLIVCLSVVQSSIYVLLLSVGFRSLRP